HQGRRQTRYRRVLARTFRGPLDSVSCVAQIGDYARRRHGLPARRDFQCPFENLLHSRRAWRRRSLQPESLQQESLSNFRIAEDFHLHARILLSSPHAPREELPHAEREAYSTAKSARPLKFTQSPADLMNGT